MKKNDDSIGIDKDIVKFEGSDSNKEQDDQEPSEEYLSFTQPGIKKYREIQKESTQKFFVWMIAGTISGLVTSGYLGSFLESRMKNKLRLRNYRIMTFLVLMGGISYHGSKLARRDFIRGRKEIERNPEYCTKVDKDTAKRMMQERGEKNPKK